GFPVTLDPSGLQLPVALADLDGDGGAEILAVVTTGDVHCLRSNGTDLDGWPVATGFGATAPVVARFGAGRAPAIVLTARDVLYAFELDGTPRFAVPLDDVVDPPQEL